MVPLNLYGSLISRLSAQLFFTWLNYSTKCEKKKLGREPGNETTCMVACYYSRQRQRRLDTIM